MRVYYQLTAYNSVNYIIRMHILIIYRPTFVSRMTSIVHARGATDIRMVEVNSVGWHICIWSRARRQ